MITKRVEVRQVIEVTVDETQFTPEWMASFRESFYHYRDLDAHMGHLAQLQAREVIDRPQLNNKFIEGYGNAANMGIATRTIDTIVEVF